jgi:hypothetical protein
MRNKSDIGFKTLEPSYLQGAISGNVLTGLYIWAFRRNVPSTKAVPI